MACPKSDHSQCVGDVALSEQQTNTNTVMQPQHGLGYSCVSIRLIHALQTTESAKSGCSSAR
jgi:hypothetical protein